jgi:hypothetical protein
MLSVSMDAVMYPAPRAVVLPGERVKLAADACPVGNLKRAIDKYHGHGV